MGVSSATHKKGISYPSDIAMYRSKDDGRNRYNVYSHEQREFLRH